VIKIDLATARKFILGSQGLWPGRRWRGARGLDAAMRAMQYLQLDPLQIVARAQDIALYGRVLDYTPEGWEQPTYQKRAFFDWGGWLAVRPMAELPHWRVVMRREKTENSRIRDMGKAHAQAVIEMRAVLRDRGTVSNRDFDAKTRQRTSHYRGRKDSALALYYLWRTGEVMTHHRERFERVYALAESVAPADMRYESSDELADRFLLRKEVAFSGLSRLQRTPDSYSNGDPTRRAASLLTSMLSDGELAQVQVEGWKHTHYVCGEDLPMLNALAAGRIPKGWKTLSDNTTEVIFLSPLEPVSARGRAKTLFDFDYIWEVYKPADKRKHGYYTLPVLWGDRLVARFDSRLDRERNTLVILGFWLEDPKLSRDAAFAEALGNGFGRFVRFLGANQIDVKAIQEPSLRKRVAACLETQS
jgi:uncharacterized protein